MTELTNTQLNYEKERYQKQEEELGNKLREIDHLKGELNQIIEEKGELQSQI